MKRTANVRSVEALTRFKAAMHEFADTAQLGLSEAHSGVQRTMSWLQQEQARHWQIQVRKRAEKVAQAKAELQRAQISSAENRSRCVEERKALEKAQRQLEEAEEKIKRVRYWCRTLERESHQFRGQTQHLATALERELPKNVARLERMIDSLEAYVKLAPPPTDPIRSDETGTTGTPPPHEVTGEENPS